MDPCTVCARSPSGWLSTLSCALCGWHSIVSESLRDASVVLRVKAAVASDGLERHRLVALADALDAERRIQAQKSRPALAPA